MAHFYGQINGSRGKASRLGTVNSGLNTTAASWAGAVEVYLTRDATTGQDIATVDLIPWRGQGTTRRLYHGPVSGEWDCGCGHRNLADAVKCSNCGLGWR
jgi:hypothetical protein